MTPIEQRADEYRVKLGLMPWSDFTGQQLAAIDKLDQLTEEQRRVMKYERRRCGKTTRGLLLAIVEAEFSGWDLMVIGSGDAHTRAMCVCALDLLERLNLDISVRRTASSKPVIVYVDHLAGYAANTPH